MKYLVTFVCGEKHHVIDYYDEDLDETGNACVEIHGVAFYTEKIETNENQTLSDMIDKTKEKLLKEGYWFEEAHKTYHVKWTKCVGITPIINDEIEEAIQKHCNYSFRN